MFVSASSRSCFISWRTSALSLIVSGLFSSFFADVWLASFCCLAYLFAVAIHLNNLSIHFFFESLEFCSQHLHQLWFFSLFLTFFTWWLRRLFPDFFRGALFLGRFLWLWRRWLFRRGLTFALRMLGDRGRCFGWSLCWRTWGIFVLGTWLVVALGLGSRWLGILTLFCHKFFY